MIDAYPGGKKSETGARETMHTEKHVVLQGDPKGQSNRNRELYITG